MSFTLLSIKVWIHLAIASYLAGRHTSEKQRRLCNVNCGSKWLIRQEKPLSSTRVKGWSSSAIISMIKSSIALVRGSFLAHFLDFSKASPTCVNPGGFFAACFKLLASLAALASSYVFKTLLKRWLCFRWLIRFDMLKLVLLLPPRGTCLEHLLQVTSDLSSSETSKLQKLTHNQRRVVCF